MSEGTKKGEKEGLGISGVRIDVPDDKFAELVDKLVNDNNFRKKFESAPMEAFAEIGMPISEEGRSKIEENVRAAFSSTMAPEPGTTAYPVPAVIVGVKVAVQSRTTIVPRYHEP